MAADGKVGPGTLEAIVVTHDSAGVLPACLGALVRDGVPATVVDNASRDGSADLAERLGASLIRNGRNEGYGRGNNLGIAHATAGYVLVANPDVVLDEGAAAELLAAASRYPDAGLFAPRIVEPSGRFFFQPRSLLAPYLPNPGGRLALPEGDVCAPFLSGACLMIRRDLFLGLGGFDPDIFLFYEDDDLCRRVADAGYALVHVHAAVARHVRGGSSAAARGRVFNARWHLAWSRGHVCRKYGLPVLGWGAIATNALKAAGFALLLDRRRAERHAGVAAGTLAFRRGRTALDRQGLA